MGNYFARFGGSLRCKMQLYSTLFLEGIYLATKEMIEKSIGSEGIKFFPFILFLFFFLILSNLLGMIPYSFTLTSHFSITFGLALTIFIAVNIIAIRTHKLHFLGFFIPGGSPLTLAPLFIVVELLSYFARVISISMRLFANLLAGHMLLKILAGFA